jgi:hypothetical protein
MYASSTGARVRMIEWGKTNSARTVLTCRSRQSRFLRTAEACDKCNRLWKIFYLDVHYRRRPLPTRRARSSPQRRLHSFVGAVKRAATHCKLDSHTVILAVVALITLRVNMGAFCVAVTVIVEDPDEDAKEAIVFF